MPIDNLDDIRGDWAMISDQVMGGVSEVNFYELEEEGNKFYRLEGVVSTANNGIFKIESKNGLESFIFNMT